jgi:AraC-like DNA-binding protein
MRRLHIILVRYFCVFLLFSGLLLLPYLFIYRYIAGVTLRNELAAVSQSMEQGMTAFDSCVKVLNNIVITADGDPRFTRLKPGTIKTQARLNPAALKDMRDMVNMALLPFPLPLDSGFLFPGGEAVTRKSVFPYPGSVPFYGAFFRTDALSREDWTALLAASRPFLPARLYRSAYYGDYEALIYSARWAGAVPAEIVFFAALPVDGIVAMIASAEVSAAANIRLYDGGGSLLFARENGSGGAHGNARGDARGSAHSGAFYPVNVQTPSGQFRFQTELPHSYIEAKMRPLTIRMVLFAGIVVLFAILLSLFFTWRSSEPERGFLEHFDSGGKTGAGFNIFKRFKLIFLELAENISSVYVRLDNAIHLIRAQTIIPIRSALESGDEAAACLILRNCAAALPKPESPPVAGFLADVISAMLKDMLSENDGLVPSLDLPEYAPGRQEELFTSAYPACFARICQAMKARREKDLPALGRAILAWINEHLYDPALYMKMATDHFSISAPTLQKFVKQCTGQTFQNYVEQRRLAQSCELLSNTRDTVAAIAKTCGFFSAVTFTQSFKRVYGFPPSRLREIQ